MSLSRIFVLRYLPVHAVRNPHPARTPRTNVGMITNQTQIIFQTTTSSQLAGTSTKIRGEKKCQLYTINENKPTCQSHYKNGENAKSIQMWSRRSSSKKQPNHSKRQTCHRNHIHQNSACHHCWQISEFRKLIAKYSLFAYVGLQRPVPPFEYCI